MTDVAYNSPQYGYGTGVPPQPVPPQPMPMPSDQADRPEQPVASYDVDPSPGHAPPAVVASFGDSSTTAPAGEPTAAVSFDKPASDAPLAEAAASESGPADSAWPVSAPPVPSPEPEAEAEEAASSVPPEAAVSETAAETGSDAVDEPATPTSPSGRVAVQVVDRLRSTAERGTTTVPTPVIEKIATLAVREVPGVYDFATTEATAGSSRSVAEGGDGGERPLAIEIDGKTATVTLHLVIEYGFAVHSVTEKVRTKVISALENLFSLDITAVDIVIDDIHLEDPAE
jgi:uncharacterized alkaline shock family protein YloU